MHARARSLQLVLLVASMLVAACAGILGIKKKDASHPFEHRPHLVAGVNCVQCHRGMTKATSSDDLHLPTTADCVGCHQKPHDTRDCFECHGQESTRFAAAAARDHLKFDHEKHLPGLNTQCVPCHSAAGTRDPTTMRPAMAQCFTCHEHRDQFQLRTCDACHRDLPSEKVVPDSHIVHEGDWVREHGVRAAAARDLCATCHTETECTSCHGVTVAALPWKLAFDQPSFGQIHAAGFFTRHPDEARAQPGLCSTCHSESFCQACHDARKVSATGGGKSPHPAGWVRAVGGDHGPAARADPLSCASCHGGAGESLCIGCHRVGGPGGNPHGPGFKSARDKLHDEPCVKCHA